MATVESLKSKKEIEKVKKILLENNYRDFVLFCFGINTGLRISDILSLNIKDVKGKNSIQIYEKKTGKLKKFPLNENLKSIMKEYTKNKNPNEALFSTRFHNRLDRIEAYRIINIACKKAKIDCCIGTHTMRKTFGYYYYKQFKDIAMLQKIFNHSTPETTLRYIGIEQDKIDESYKKFML